MTFGEKLKALRKHHNYTQDALAEKLELSRQTISRWEAGDTFPDIKQIMTISEIFMVSVDYLMYDKAEDENTGHFTDFQSLRILFWVCTAINICGMAVSMIGWLGVRMPLPIVMGLIMKLLACVFFEVFPPKGIDRVMMQYARRRFYAANIWMLLPTPIMLAVEFAVYTERYSSLLPYIVGAAIYLAAAAMLTVHLMRKYRK